MRLFIGFGLVVLMLSGSPAAVAANIGNPAYTDPGKTDADFPFQGEYVGEITHDGQPLRFGVQVIALGEGAFEAVAYPGGLPGAGWTPPNKIKGKGARAGDGQGDGQDGVGAEVRFARWTAPPPSSSSRKAAVTLQNFRR